MKLDKYWIQDDSSLVDIFGDNDAVLGAALNTNAISAAPVIGFFGAHSVPTSVSTTHLQSSVAVIRTQNYCRETYIFVIGIIVITAVTVVAVSDKSYASIRNIVIAHITRNANDITLAKVARQARYGNNIEATIKSVIK